MIGGIIKILTILKIFLKNRNIYISDNDKNIQPGQLVDYIKKHPFCSIYMNF